MLEILLRNHTEARANDERYNLVLHNACYLGKIGFAELLISRGMDVDESGSYHGSALQAAAANGHIDVCGNIDAAENFLENLCRSVQGAEVFIDEAIVAVAQQNLPDERILLLLLQYAPQTSGRLIHVCKHASRSPVVYMLGHGVDVNGEGTHGMTLLLSAAQHLKADAVHALVETGAHVGPQGRGRLQTPLCSALSTLARVDRRTPMFWATEPSFTEKIHRCKRIMKTLLANGASVQSKDGDDDDPHHLVSVIGDENSLELLAQRSKGEEEIS